MPFEHTGEAGSCCSPTLEILREVAGVGLQVAFEERRRERTAVGEDDAAYKVLYIGAVAAEKRWTRSLKGWSQALNQLALYFEGRLPI